MGLSFNTLTVLPSVASGVRYGFDIMENSGLKSGQVYRALSRLEELGLVRSRWESADKALAEKRPRRHILWRVPVFQIGLRSPLVRKDSWCGSR